MISSPSSIIADAAFANLLHSIRLPLEKRWC